MNRLSLFAGPAMAALLARSEAAPEPWLPQRNSQPRTAADDKRRAKRKAQRRARKITRSKR